MRWLFNDGENADRRYARTVIRYLQKRDAVVPSIWPFEVANVIARAEAKSQLQGPNAKAFIDRLGDFQINIDPESYLYALTNTLELSRDHNLTAYEASYLEVSLRKSFPLATLDQKLKKAARNAGAEIFA